MNNLEDSKLIENSMAKVEKSQNPIIKIKKKLLTDWDFTQFVLGIFLVILLALSPIFIKSPYYLGIVILTTLYAFVGLAINITIGITGLLLIGHVTFFGVGSYTVIMLLNYLNISPWIGIPLAAIPAVLLSLLFSFLTLRYGLKLDYFALFSLAVMVTMSIAVTQFEIFGRAEGLWIPFRGFSFHRMAFQSKSAYLYIILGLLLCGLILTYRLLKSKMGKYLLAIRDDELAAASLGVNTSKYKTIALAITAGLEGIAGGFHVIYITLVEPQLVFNLAFNIELIIAPIIGGLGSILGPILGAILNKPVVELVRGNFSGVRAGTTLIIYGLFLIIFILFLPEGVLGLVKQIYNRIISKNDSYEEIKE